MTWEGIWLDDYDDDDDDDDDNDDDNDDDGGDDDADADDDDDDDDNDDDGDDDLLQLPPGRHGAPHPARRGQDQEAQDAVSRASRGGALLRPQEPQVRRTRDY